MIEAQLHVGAIGAAIVIRVHDLNPGSPKTQPYQAFDLSPFFSGGTVDMLFQSPAGVSKSLTATAATITTLPGYVGDGTDGYAQAIVPNAAFLDTDGRWQIQLKAVAGAETIWFPVVTRLVYGNLAAP